jgi:antitoxin MazE
MNIQVEIKKWGNSLGLRIPYQIANSFNIAENSQVKLTIERDRLIIEKVDNQPDLDAILDSIPDDFEYLEDIAEFVNNQSVGQEFI